MRKIKTSIWKLAICRDAQGQDLVEYALLAGFIAVAAGIFIPNVSDSMSKIYSRLASKLIEANG